MGKVLKTVAVVAAVAVAFVPGVGPALTGAILSTVGTSFAAAGIVSTLVAGIGAIGVMQGLGIISKAIGLGPKQPRVSPSTFDRLHANIDPSTPRKIIFGRTAMATDIRYQEWTDDQSYLHQIICVASHRVEEIQELWLDDKKAWSSASGITSGFAGYLTVTPVVEGSAANTIFISNKWNTQRRLTGCAYVYLRFKVTANSKKSESPFIQSIPSRMTVIGAGARLYDPRFDISNGGSGPQLPTDQATWNFNNGRNPALQLLWYLIGWQIGGKVAVGRGIPLDRIDLASFITAANACDEIVVRADGTTEPRYRADGIFSEGDPPPQVFDALCSAMNAVLRDAGGRLRLDIVVNDLAAPIITFDDNDILNGFDWQQTPSIETTFNVVRGRYVDPSPNSLYQMVDYPEIRLASIDGMDRVMAMDLPLVQSPSQAQRLAKQALQRAQYPGTFAADFTARGWAVQIGDPVKLTFSALGWSNKLFRVTEQTIRPDGVCPLVLREEDESIYARDRDERPAVRVANPNEYNPLLAPLIAAISPGAVASLVPADVQNFQVQVFDSSAHLQWDIVQGSGLSHYVVKFQSVLSGATWGSAVTLVAKVPISATGVSVPAMNGTYLVKAVNLFDVESVNPAILSSNVQSLNAINVVATIAEGTPWAGVLTDVVIDPLGLMMSGGGNMDLWPDIDAVENFDIGNVDNGFVIDGTYDFEDSLDLGAVYTSRLTASLDVAGLDWRSNLDEIPDLDAVSNFDGADPSLWNVELQVQTSNDGTTWGPWRTFLVGDYTARAFRFRARLTSGDPYVTPILQAASVTVDMPDRTIGGNDLAAPSGGLTVSFGNAYRAVPAIAIAAQGLATGDYYAITAKTVGGFQIQFFNSAGTGVARTFDYVAKGYGVEA